VSSPYLDRLLRAAMKRRALDTLAIRALMKATHLLGLALAQRLRECRDSGDPLLASYARWQEEAIHVGLLRETINVLGHRWDKIPERQRPHYSPRDRFRILRLKTLLALSAEDAARTFRVSGGTILRWERESQAVPDKDTVGALVKPVAPVRRFADLVRDVIHSLTLAGFPGDASLAAFLARAGWKLSRRTVQRIRREEPTAPPPEPLAVSSGRAVRARRPHHVWMMDITEIPGFLRLFSFKLAVLFDVFSRAPLTARVFLFEPTGPALARLVTAATRRFGAPPHFVSDRGSQFASEAFRRTLARRGVQPRYGAIGKTGSIALVERFFRTLKEAADLHHKPPLLPGDLVDRLRLAFEHYIWLRPHAGLGGATPAERLLGLRPAHLNAVSPPRGRLGEQLRATIPFDLRHLGPGSQLLYLHRTAA
jgi:putative transposase